MYLLTKKQGLKLALYAFVLFFCILIPSTKKIFGAAITENDVHYINIEDYYNATSTDVFDTSIYVPPLNDYDFMVLTCWLQGRRALLSIDSFDFAGAYDLTDIDYYLGLPSIGTNWTLVDIVLKSDITPGTFNLQIDFSESPTQMFCNASLFDYANKTVGDVSQEFSVSKTSDNYSETFLSSGSEDRLLFFHGSHCSSCGDLQMSTSFNDIAYTNNNPFNDEYFGIAYNAELGGSGDVISVFAPGRSGVQVGSGLTIELLDEEDIFTELPTEEYFTVGDYVIPKSINCYENNNYCNMVFGYGLSAYSRAITEQNPSDQDYPAFYWWWPDATATTSIYNATLRDHIEIGQQMFVNFSFDTPTTTDTYTIEIQDPNDSVIGSSSSFVVDVNLISSSTGIMSTCLGDCDDTFLGEIFCGLKKTVCFFTVPSEDSTLYIKGAFEDIKSVFPFRYITDITSSIQTGINQADNRSGVFSIPFPQTTATGTSFYMLGVINSSSTGDLIGEDNSNLFRQSLGWLIWIIATIGVVYFLVNRSK